MLIRYIRLPQPQAIQLPCVAALLPCVVHSPLQETLAAKTGRTSISGQWEIFQIRMPMSDDIPATETMIPSPLRSPQRQLHPCRCVYSRIRPGWVYFQRVSPQGFCRIWTRRQARANRLRRWGWRPTPIPWMRQCRVQLTEPRWHRYWFLNYRFRWQEPFPSWETRWRWFCSLLESSRLLLRPVRLSRNQIQMYCGQKRDQ